MILRLQSAVSLLTCSCLVSMASATASNIGLVMTTGEVQIDGSSVRGNSALFSGSLVSSGDVNSNLQFSDGTNAVMKPGTTMMVYREHSVLQNGVTMQQGLEKHTVVADGLRISGTTPNAAALIGVKDASHVEVAAQTGAAEVRTPSGNLVARVEPGKDLSFTITQAASGDQRINLTLNGVLNDHYRLTDNATQVTYQLQGSNLNALVGQPVRVDGSIPAINPTPSSPQLVAVSKIAVNPNAAYVGDGQQGPGAAPAATGVAFWTTGSIIFLVLVAVGGTLLGLAAAGEFGSSPSTPVTPTTP